MTQEKRSDQLSLLRDFEKALLRFKNSILEWWERRGNRVVKLESLNALLLLSALFIVIWSVSTFPVIGELSYLLITSSKEVSTYTIYFAEAFVILFIIGLLLIYLRRIKQYTFRQAAVTRVSLIRWESRSKYAQWTFLVTYMLMFLITFAYSFVAPFLKSQLLINNVIAFPMSVFIAISTTMMSAAFFVYVMFSLGMRDNEKTAYSFDYITRIDDFKNQVPSKRLSLDVNYMCENSVRRLGRLMLFDRYIGDELNLGPALCNVFVGLFWGDNDEKKQANDFLIRSRDLLLLHRQELAYRLIVRNLVDFCDNTRDLCVLRDTLSLDISPVKRVTTLRKLSENSVIVTMLGVCIALISFIVSRLLPS